MSSAPNLTSPIRMLGRAAPVSAGSAIRIAAELPRAAAPLAASAAWDWDDGTRSRAVRRAEGDRLRLEGTHDYPTPGVRRIALMVGATAGAETALAVRHLAVVRPTSGIAAGSGQLRLTHPRPSEGRLVPPASMSATFAFLVGVRPTIDPLPGAYVCFTHAANGADLASSDVSWIIERDDGWLHCGGSGLWAADALQHPFRMDVDGRQRSALTGPRRLSLLVYEAGGQPGTDSPIYRAAGTIGPGSVRIYR